MTGRLARVILDGPEVPIMDGSAAPFVEQINRVGKLRQDAERKTIIIKQAIFVSQGDKFAGFLPAPIPWMDLEIDFNARPIRKQSERSFSNHSYGYVFSSDRPTCFASLPLNANPL